jgi:hypothetical protein
LNHLSRPNVKHYGVEIKGEAVVQDEHALFLIAEARDEAHLREFLRPFHMVGSLALYPASTCAGVVANGGCASAISTSGPVPALEPKLACQHAIEEGLVVYRVYPLNEETSIQDLVSGVQPISCSMLLRLLDQCDHVWRW